MLALTLSYASQTIFLEILNGFGALTGSSRLRSWPPTTPRQPNALAPVPLQGLHRYYTLVRPCGSHRYSGSCGFCHLSFSLSSLPAQRQCRPDTFTRSAREPEPSSRHLYAGEHLASRQVSSRLIPRQRLHLGFALVHTLSTRHRMVCFRSPSRFTPDALLYAFSTTLPTPALDRRSLQWFVVTSCKATTEGHTSITRTALLGWLDLLHRFLPCIRVTPSSQ